MEAVEATTVVGGNGSLYIGDLESNVSEVQLCDLFSTVAPVVSVKICRDETKPTSLGYAYVNFASSHDASLAREKLNFTPVNGKPIRIMFSQRDSSMRKSGFANIFIGNLDDTIDHRALFDTFTAFGNILSCKVATDHSGKSKGYGFVQFDNQESAQKAIAQLNGTLINEKKVNVGLFVSRHERTRGQGSRKFTNVYVKNFPDSTTVDDLKNLFGKFGVIRSAVVMTESDGRSRCFGFVDFESTNAAAAAVQGLNGTSFSEGKILFVERAKKKAEREAELRETYETERQNRYERVQGSNLYLKNLDKSLDEESIKELFSEFGTVTSCKILRNSRGMSNGAGFVVFSTVEEASKALSGMNGRVIAHKSLHVSVAWKKEERRAELQEPVAQMQAQFLPMPGFHGFHYSGPTRFSPQQLCYGRPAGLLLPHNTQHMGYGYQQPFIPSDMMRPAVPSYFMFPVQQFHQAQQYHGRSYHNPRRDGASSSQVPPQE